MQSRDRGSRGSCSSRSGARRTVSRWRGLVLLTVAATFAISGNGCASTELRTKAAKVLKVLPIQTPPPVSWAQIQAWGRFVDSNGIAKGVEVLGAQIVMRDKAIELLLELLKVEGYRYLGLPPAPPGPK